MRINKFLAQCGVASRRKCDDIISSGEISVNGKSVKELGMEINPKKDIIEYNGKQLKLADSFSYFKLHKPKGYICSAKDEKGRKTVFDLIHEEGLRLFSVGRLDYNTEGLLIITNDGDFSNKVMHPSNEIDKEYVVRIEGQIKESELAVMRAGVVVEGERLPPAKITFLGYDGNDARLSVVINEGINRQVRKMFEAIGKNIILLKRVRISNVKLGGLKRGEYKALSQAEILSLSGSEK